MKHVLSICSSLMMFAGVADAGQFQQIAAVDIVVKSPTDAAFNLPVNSSAGLPIAWEALTGPVVVTGTTVTMTGGSGAVTLRGRQSGDSVYDPAPDRFVTFVVEAGGGFLSVSAGEAHVAGIKSDGRLWTWGRNTNGQLGDSTTTDRATPSPIVVSGSDAWITVACGNSHTVARRSDGTLWAWGANSSGQLGLGTTEDRLFPTQIGTATNWSGIACGANHTVAWRADGSLYAWGNNSQGQLGDGTIANRSVPVRIGVAQDWAEASCGALHTLARRSGGSLWAWGGNAYGQLGDGTTVRRLAPVRIGTASDWVEVSSGFFFNVARRSGGTLWSWGNNDSGQLGDGSVVGKTTPQQVGTDTDWAAASCGAACVISRKTDGWMWAWGDNSAGQLGDLTTLDRRIPVRTLEGPWGAVTVGAACVLAVRNQSLWTWGTNDNEQLALPPSITGVTAVPPAARLPYRTPQVVGSLQSVVNRNSAVMCSVGSFLPPMIHIVSGPAAIAPSGNEIIFSGDGDVVVEVSHPGDGAWEAAPTQTFTIQADGTPPIFTTAPTNQVVQATGPTGAVVSFTVAATDAVSGSAQVICTPPSGSLFPGGITNVTCTATDAVGNSATHSFSVKVNRAPVAQPLSLSGITSIPIPFSATDADGDSLTYSIVTQPTVGTVTVNRANLSYKPAAGFVGTVQFEYRASDGTSNSLPATISIEILNAAPVASPMALQAVPGGSTSFVLQGLDLNLQPLTYEVVSPPANGSLTGTAPNLSYTPNAGFLGNDSFTYRVSDGSLVSATATVTVLVANNPTVNSANVQTNEDQSLPITLTGASPTGANITMILVSQPAHGSLSGTLPNLIYTPAENYFGLDSFTFKSSDGGLESLVGTISINVVEKNDAPVATSGNVLVTEDTTKAIQLSASDVENDPLTFIISEQPSHGMLTGTAPNLSYTPTANYNGPDSFSFHVTDGDAESATATISITVQSINDRPETAFDVFSVNEDSSLVVAVSKSVLKNDTDAQNGAPEESNGPLTAILISQPAHASNFTFNADGTFSYTPIPNFHGVDGFTYAAVDSLGAASELETVVIVVWAVNDAPVVSSQQMKTLEDVPVSLQLSSADVDLLWLFDPTQWFSLTPPNFGPAPHDADPSFAIVSAPSHGTLSGTLPNLIYTPAANFHGTDTFTYTSNDGLATSIPAVVTIVIQADNDGDALPDTWEMAAFSSLNFSPTDDPDGDGQNNTFELITGSDPNDSTSRLQLELAGNDPKDGTISLNQVKLGILYTLESSEDMVHWTAVATQEFVIEGPGVIFDPRTDTVEKRFYRVRVGTVP